MAGCGRVCDRGRRAAPVTSGRERVLVVEDDEEETVKRRDDRIVIERSRCFFRYL